MESNTVSRQQAVGEVRNMAFQFADMYYAFVKVLRDRYGDEEALDIARRVLFMRASKGHRRTSMTCLTCHIWDGILLSV